MSEDDILEKIKKNLRCLLISNAFGITWRQVVREYEETLGSNLDSEVKRLGYKSVIDFFHSVPDTVQVQHVAHGEDILCPVENDKIRHINELVLNQNKKICPRKSVPRQYHNRPIVKKYTSSPYDSVQKPVKSNDTRIISPEIPSFEKFLCLNGIQFPYKQVGRPLNSNSNNLKFNDKTVDFMNNWSNVRHCKQNRKLMISNFHFSKGHPTDPAILSFSVSEKPSFTENTKSKISTENTADRKMNSENQKHIVQDYQDDKCFFEKSNWKNFVKTDTNDNEYATNCVQMKSSGIQYSTEDFETRTVSTQCELQYLDDLTDYSYSYNTKDDYKIQRPVKYNDRSYEHAENNYSNRVDNNSEAAWFSEIQNNTADGGLNFMIKNNFRTLLSENPNGIFMNDLRASYEERFGYNFDFMDFGFKSVKEMVLNHPEIFVPKYSHSQPGKWEIFDARTHISNVDGKTLKRITSDIKENIAILAQENSQGIHLEDLFSMYLKRWNKNLNIEVMGFSNIMSFVQQLDCIKIKVLPTTWLILPKENEETTYFSDPILSKEILHQLWKFDYPPDVCGPDDTYVKFDTSLIKEKYLKVVVADVINPNKLWLHLLEKLEFLNNMMETIHGYYETYNEDYILHTKVNIVEGLMVVAKYFENNRWHRCLVQSISTEYYTVELLYVDYGTVTTVSITELRFLVKQFAVNPIQTIRASLWGLFPLNDSTWAIEACDFLFNSVLNKRLIAETVALHEEEPYIDLYLLDTSSKNEKSLHDLLIEKRYAEFIGSMSLPKNKPPELILPQKSFPPKQTLQEKITPCSNKSKPQTSTSVQRELIPKTTDSQYSHQGCPLSYSPYVAPPPYQQSTELWATNNVGYVNNQQRIPLFSQYSSYQSIPPPYHPPYLPVTQKHGHVMIPPPMIQCIPQPWYSLSRVYPDQQNLFYGEQTFQRNPAEIVNVKNNTGNQSRFINQSEFNSRQNSSFSKISNIPASNSNTNRRVFEQNFKLENNQEQQYVNKLLENKNLGKQKSYENKRNFEELRKQVSESIDSVNNNEVVTSITELSEIDPELSNRSEILSTVSSCSTSPQLASPDINRTYNLNNELSIRSYEPTLKSVTNNDLSSFLKNYATTPDKEKIDITTSVNEINEKMLRILTLPQSNNDMEYKADSTKDEPLKENKNKIVIQHVVEEKTLIPAVYYKNEYCVLINEVLELENLNVQKIKKRYPNIQFQLILLTSQEFPEIFKELKKIGIINDEIYCTPLSKVVKTLRFLCPKKTNLIQSYEEIFEKYKDK